MSFLNVQLKSKGLMFIFIAMVVFSLFSCQNEDKIEHFATSHLLQCDAETVTNNMLVTSDDSLFCSGAIHQSIDYSHSGKHSIRSSKDNPYTMTIEINNMVVDGHYRAEIWRYGNNDEGKLVIEAKNFWKGVSVATEKEKNGWEKLILDFHIPPNVEGNSFKVFFWNSGENDIYVDDLKLEYLDHTFPSYDEEYLRIEIEDMDKIQDIRKKAFEEKMLITSKKSYVRAIVSFGDKKMPASVRLKGDWLDHIEGKKWSFRIKLDKGYSWRGMRTFNIQTPEARSFLDEWVAHKIAEKEDILTTRYDFVPVEINGQNLGIYAYEEHFEKQLVENKKRREGPILKFSEDHLWQARKEKLEQHFPLFASAPIVPFKKNKTMRSPALKNQFEQAKNELNAFRNCSADTKDMFDMDHMAKYLAFIDLTRGNHGIIWHNLRFYFNPVLYKLEPIAYDLYANDGFWYLDRPILGNFDAEKINDTYSNLNSFYHLFADSSLTSRYIYYLEKFSDESYLSSFFAEEGDLLKTNEESVEKEFDNYSYHHDFLFNQQAEIRKKLPEMKQKYKENYASILKSKKAKYKTINAPELPSKMIPLYMHLYKENWGVQIENFYPNDYNIVGYLDKNKKGVNLENPLEIKKYFDKPTSYSLHLPKEFTKKKIKLIIEKNNQLDTLKCEIFPWKKPSKIDIPHLAPNIPKWMHREGNKLVIKSGKYTVKDLIVIPKGWEVVVEPSTSITFSHNEAGFWSESPVFFFGEKNKPITIIGDKNKGFSVVQTAKKSELNYVKFIHLDTFKEKTWQLTGAANFYEADVELIGCEFRENQCEDALNIVRSTFVVKNCSFDKIFSDAFDSDFSNGELTSTEFNNIGNDAIDFSGSQVLIQDCDISHVNDKGISGGEKSNLIVKNCSISNCKIAIASKDQSEVNVNDIQIDNCDYGFVAFRKKPEYGPASIAANHIEITNTKNEALIEQFSTLILEGKIINGTEKEVVNLFY